MKNNLDNPLSKQRTILNLIIYIVVAALYNITFISVILGVGILIVIIVHRGSGIENNQLSILGIFSLGILHLPLHRFKKHLDKEDFGVLWKRKEK